MSYDFNIDEIFEMAEQIERNGAKFYRKMAENISDILNFRLFLDLAAMEEDHEKIFASMRKNLSDQEQRPTVFDPEGEATLYLRALADLRVFDGEGKKDFFLPSGLSDEERMKEIFRAAIGIEKESIVFYLGMKELVPKNLGKSKIDDIIREEMKHIRMLSNKLISTKL